jgi:iron complex outermembrane receptor protein/vitamin B12 transporter
LSFGGSESWRLRLFGSYSDSEGSSYPEDSGGAELAVLPVTDIRSAKSKRFGLSSQWPVSENWNLNFLATSYEQDSSYLSPGVAPGVRDAVPPNGADSNLKRQDLALNAVVDLGDDLTATLGLDYYDEEGVSEGFVEFFPGFSLPAGFEFSRTVTGLFGELHYSSDSGVTLMASIRNDDPGDESAETTSRLGVMYALNDGRTTLRANWGQGFSLPSFFSLASPLVGNPDLLPETSESYDIGVSHQFANSGVDVTVTLFHNEFTDLIDFESTVFQMINRDVLDIKGVELHLAYPISEDLSVQVQATYLDMDLADGIVPLRQRPDWRAGMMLRWAGIENLEVDASWLYAGETFDSSIPTGDQYLDSYNRFDLTVSYSFANALRAYLTVTNLLDEDYYEAIGFPASGSRTRLGLRYDF